jgi:hypothetical protein
MTELIKNLTVNELLNLMNSKEQRPSASVGVATGWGGQALSI